MLNTYNTINKLVPVEKSTSQIATYFSQADPDFILVETVMNNQDNARKEEVKNANT